MNAKEKDTKADWVDPDDAPELTGDEIDRPDAVWRVGGKAVSKEAGKAAFRSALRGKTRVNIHLDNDVIAYFKSQAAGRGYQTLMNNALRRLMEEETPKKEWTNELKQDLIEAIRAELRLSRQIVAQPQTEEIAVEFAGFRSRSEARLANRVLIIGTAGTGSELFSAVTAANTAQPVFGPLSMTKGNA